VIYLLQTDKLEPMIQNGSRTSNYCR